MKLLFNKISFFIVGLCIGFSVVGILLLSSEWAYDTILFHPSNYILWLLIIVIFPICIGVLFAHFMSQRKIPKRRIVIIYTISIIQLICFVFMLYVSKELWGYSFKRPIVFKELKQAEIVSNCYHIKDLDNNNDIKLELSLDNEKKAEDYYGMTDRSKFVFEKNAIIIENNNILDSVLLNNIVIQIEESELLKSDQFYLNCQSDLDAYLTEFTNVNGESYYYVSLIISYNYNEYGHCEFLFSDNLELVKKQMYFSEHEDYGGFETSFIIPVISLMLILFGFVVGLFIEGLYRILKKNKK